MKLIASNAITVPYLGTDLDGSRIVNVGSNSSFSDIEFFLGGQLSDDELEQVRSLWVDDSHSRSFIQIDSDSWLIQFKSI